MQEAIPGRKADTEDAEEPCSEIEKCKEANDLTRKGTQKQDSSEGTGNDLFSFSVLAATY